MDVSLEEEVNRLSQNIGAQRSVEGPTAAPSHQAVSGLPTRGHYGARPLSPHGAPRGPPVTGGLPSSPQVARRGLDVLSGSFEDMKASMGSPALIPEQVSAGQAISDLPAPPISTSRGNRDLHTVTAGVGGRGVRPDSSSAAAVLAGRRSVSALPRVDRRGDNAEDSLKRKERVVRLALKDKQKHLIEEAKRLALVDKELAHIAIENQAEINELRKRLEVVDRDLTGLERDTQRKKAAYEKAQKILDDKLAEKGGVTSRLTELILASEKKRNDKLNEIMKKMTAEQGLGSSGEV